MKRFIRFVAKSDVEGMNNLTTEWMDTETTNLIDIIELANTMNSIVTDSKCFKNSYIEEADEVVDNTGRLLSAKKELNSLYGKMNMVTISDLLDNANYYVNCETEAEAVDFVKCMTNAGCEWYRDTDDTVNTRWFIDKKDTCYYVSKLYNPEKYVLRRINKNDIYRVYTGACGCVNSYKIFNWEDVMHG